jgi:hypothetical protein
MRCDDVETFGLIATADGEDIIHYGNRTPMLVLLLLLDNVHHFSLLQAHFNKEMKTTA